MVSAFSIGSSQRSNFLSLPKQPNPAPGQYDSQQQVRSKSPNCTIGNAQRNTKLTLHRDISPGPARYKTEETNEQLKGPAYKFGVKHKFKDSHYGIPGPGAYQNRESSSPNIKHSLGYRSQDIYNFLQINNNPGPGQYEQKFLQGSTSFNKTNTSLGRSRKDQNVIKNHNFPGPGQYMNTEQSSSSPKFKFGTQEKFSRFGQIRLSPPQKECQNVGPGSYVFEKINFNPKGPSISPKPRDNSGFKEGKDPPGPNAYDTVSASRFIMKKAPTFVIGKSQRSPSPISENQQTSPAPDAYNIIYADKPKSRSYKFGLSERVKLLNNPDNPSPLEYTVPYKGVEGYKFTMPPKRDIGTIFERYKQGIPGPDKYKLNTSLVLSKSPIYKIGTSQRKFGKNINQNPGPGSYGYNNDDLSTTSRTVGCVFGKDSKDKQVSFFDETPGPGQYNIKPAFADVPPYLLRKQNEKEQHDN